MVRRRRAIIQGHPDPAGNHLLHAMADAYAEAAVTAGMKCAVLRSPDSNTHYCGRRRISREAWSHPLWQARRTRCAGHSHGYFYSRSGTEPSGALEGISRTRFPARLCPGIREGSRRGSRHIPFSETAPCWPLGPHCCHDGYASPVLPLVVRCIRNAQFRAQYVELRRDQADP
jgi:hypothetical protein